MDTEAFQKNDEFFMNKTCYYVAGFTTKEKVLIHLKHFQFRRPVWLLVPHALWHLQGHEWVHLKKYPAEPI